MDKILSHNNISSIPAYFQTSNIMPKPLNHAVKRLMADEMLIDIHMASSLLSNFNATIY